MSESDVRDGGQEAELLSRIRNDRLTLIRPSLDIFKAKITLFAQYMVGLNVCYI